MKPQLSCCLMILNYNGQEHLKDCLPSAFEAAKVFGESCPVVVVDNQSTEGDAAYIQSRFPEAQLYITNKNDYLFSYNEAIRERREDIVIILNNDMRFDKNFIRPLVRHFENEDIFAVTAKMYDWEKTRVIAGKSYLINRRFWYYKHWDFRCEKVSYALYAGGGSAAFRRPMFLELGGFDPLFRPGYYEDTDLSYRAWKRGWKILYDPSSVIYHKSGMTFAKMHKQDGLIRLICRNHVLFNIKDCGSFIYALIFILFLPLRGLFNYLKGNKMDAIGIIDAIWKTPEALLQRIKCRKKFFLSDKKIMELISSTDSNLI